MSLGEGDIKDRAQKVCDAKKYCYAFQSEDKRVRKQALIDLQKYIAELKDTSQGDLQVIFNETHIHTLNGFRDKTEAVRSQAIKFMSYFLLDCLSKNDYYLTYIFPVLVERIGTVELVEECEEIRLELLQLMQAIILKYSNTDQLKPFLDDCVTILCETVKDKYPAAKEVSCKCITILSKALPEDFHKQAESLVKPVLTTFGHQRYKVRVEAVKCMGDIVMHSAYKALEEAVGPMAERLFDQMPIVRQTVIQVSARWLLEYKDRYSFFHKLLPLILTGLNDEVQKTREIAHELWEVVGLQYERENEKELKDQMDFLIERPKYYIEDLNRPKLGCRVLVQRNVGKIAPALARELGSWQADVRVRCSQLLCAVAHHAEEGLTQYLQDLLYAMYLAARDDDSRVVTNIIQGSKIMGLFVPVDTWLKIIGPAIEDGPHFGQFTVLAGLVEGAPKELICPYLEEISKVLADDDVCRSRKAKYQRELIKCVKAIFKKCNPGMYTVGRNLFTVIVTTISLIDEENKDKFGFALLDDFCESFGFNSKYEIWNRYLPELLETINRDPKSWTTVTVERCIFENILIESEQAFGENLPIIGDILEKTLDTDADPESRLRTFLAVSIALDNKDLVFKNANNLNEFLEKLVIDVLIPTLVWHAGRTAEALRTMGLACLCSVLNPGLQVEFFSDKAVFHPILDKLLPLLLSLIEDAAQRSRQLALDALALLKEIACKRTCWDNDNLIKIYPEIMKRLDDPNDSVRITSIKVLPRIFEDCPKEFMQNNYKGHHELIIGTLLTHFDDDDSVLQELISDCLIRLVGVIGKSELVDKIIKHKPVLRNRSGCDHILSIINA